AVLMYGKSSSSIDLVTVHDVQLNDGQMSIKPGVPASKAALLEMLYELDATLRKPLDLLHPNVIAMSNDCMVWWEEACHRRVIFNAPEVGRRAAVVPHPALLFAVKENNWYVFALPYNKRPTANTK